VNFVAPNPVTNGEFTRTLGRVLSRPTFFPVPAFGARLAFGEMADALLLSSQRVKPEVLEAKKFSFNWPTLEPTLRHLLVTKRHKS
jgi:NAD dependent epimerase/dehydratase family enzyme